MAPHSSGFLVCKICAGERVVASRTVRPPFSKNRVFQLFTCHRCGVGFLAPQPDDDLLEKEIYNKGYALYDFSWVRPSDSIRKRVYQTMFPHPLMRLVPSTPGTALDVGCGSGYWLSRLRERGWRAKGIDMDSTTIERLRSLGFEGYCGNVETADIGEEEYDLVLLSAVLEHLRDPELVLRKVYASLRQGGCVVIDVPNFGSLEVGLFGDSWLMFSIAHLFYFTERSLGFLLRKVGFVPEVFLSKSAELTTGYSLAQSLHLRKEATALLGAPLQLLINGFNSAGEIFVRAKKPN